MGHDYFKDPRSVLAMREGEVCMKYPDHHMRHPCGHLGDRTSAQGTRGCAWRDAQFGRGQNPVLGWDALKFREHEEINDTRMRKVTQKKTPDWAGATPLFRLLAAQKIRGVAPALTGTLGPRFARLHTQTREFVRQQV